jgi:hypothetical protein
MCFVCAKMGAGSESEKSHDIAYPLVSRMHHKSSDISETVMPVQHGRAMARHVCQPHETRRYYLGVGTGVTRETYANKCRMLRKQLCANASPSRANAHFNLVTRHASGASKRHARVQYAASQRRDNKPQKALMPSNALKKTPGMRKCVPVPSVVLQLSSLQARQGPVARDPPSLPEGPLASVHEDLRLFDLAM